VAGLRKILLCLGGAPFFPNGQTACCSVCVCCTEGHSGTGEVDFGSTRKTLLETWPLLRPPNGDVASRIVEGRTPWIYERGMSDNFENIPAEAGLL